MNVSDKVQEYLAGYAASRESVIYLARVSSDRWQIVLDDERELFVDVEAATDRLGIMAMLGKPAPERVAAVHQALLMFSALWRDTGGVRGALDGDGGALLIGEMYMPEVSESRIQFALDRMADKAAFFIDFIKKSENIGDGADAVTYRL